VPRLDRLPEGNRRNLLALPVPVNDGTPFAPLRRPLTACRLAIVTTAGLHRRGDRPFGPADQTYREIPADTPTVDIVQSHTSLGFDRVAIMRDVNVSFPIDRLRELAARGEIGGLGPNNYSFMGALRDLPRVEGETGPEVGHRLREEGVDVALITPT
jgi:D-proline reductase (dithiol) PrdB